MSLEEKDAAAESVIQSGAYAAMPLDQRMKTARELGGSVQAFDSYSVQNGRVPEQAQINDFTKSQMEGNEDDE
jgi:hypothetical protein